MGQKVSPTALRLGITESWRSRWYAPKKDYGKWAVEDERIRKLIKKGYSFAGIPRIDIERTREKIMVMIYAARPGVIIGRKGATIEKITDDLVRFVNQTVDVRIIEVEKPELSAQLIAESVAEQLEKRTAYRRTIRRAAETVMRAGAEGVKVQVKGRLGGAEIARNEDIIVGKLPLHTLRADIDYGLAVASLNKGTIGVKTWIYKGIKNPEKSHATNAQEGQIPQDTAR